MQRMGGDFGGMEWTSLVPSTWGHNGGFRLVTWAYNATSDVSREAEYLGLM